MTFPFRSHTAFGSISHTAEADLGWHCQQVCGTLAVSQNQSRSEQPGSSAVWPPGACPGQRRFSHLVPTLTLPVRTLCSQFLDEKGSLDPPHPHRTPLWSSCAYSSAPSSRSPPKTPSPWLACTCPYPFLYPPDEELQHFLPPLRLAPLVGAGPLSSPPGAHTLCSPLPHGRGDSHHQ